MKKLKITEPGYASFTDTFCGVPFKDGVSERPVMDFEANRIGSILRTVYLDEVDGEETEGKQAGAGQLVLDSMLVTAQVLSETPREAVTAETPAVATKVAYNEEQLAEIATKDGIAGLRPIGESLGVSARSISDLITKILVAQGTPASTPTNLDDALKDPAE